MVMYAHCIRFVKKKSMIKMNVMMNLGMGNVPMTIMGDVIHIKEKEVKIQF